MKIFGCILTGLLVLSCAHEQSVKREGRLLDDAELAKYRNEAPSNVNKGSREVITLGTGPVDLSNWKRNDDDAEAGDAQKNASGEIEHGAAPATPSGSTQSDGAMAETAETNTAKSDPTAPLPMTSEVLTDAGEDAGDWVEADDVTLSPVE